MNPWLFTLTALFVGLVAAVMDYCTGRIPNQLTFSASLFGLAGHSLSRGGAGFIESVVGLVICAAVPGIVYKASQGRGIGGGDIKLFAALGALLGPTQGLEAELSSFLLLGVFALFRLAFIGQLGRTLIGSMRVMVGLFVPNWRRTQGARDLSVTTMRMGPAIFAGVATVICLPYLVRWLPWLG